VALQQLFPQAGSVGNGFSQPLVVLPKGGNVMSGAARRPCQHTLYALLALAKFAKLTLHTFYRVARLAKGCGESANGRAKRDGQGQSVCHFFLLAYTLGMETDGGNMKKNGLDMNTERIIEFLGYTVVGALFFGVWIYTGNFIGALFLSLIFVIPVVLLLSIVFVPLGIFIAFIRGEL
jgi:hypothetical protein